MLYDQIWNMRSVSEQWGMNTFQRVQSSALEGRIKEYKLNCACYKIKCMKFSNKDIQSLFGVSQLVSFYFPKVAHDNYFFAEDQKGISFTSLMKVEVFRKWQHVLTTQGTPPMATALAIAITPVATAVAMTQTEVARNRPPVGNNLSPLPCTGKLFAFFR